MAILPYLRYSTIPAIWNKVGFLPSYLPNGITPVSPKLKGVNPLLQWEMSPIGFFIFVRWNIKQEKQTTWFSIPLLLTPFAFRLITHCTRSKTMLRVYFELYRPAIMITGLREESGEDFASR